MDTKYIFVTGGVVSSLGKGIISASIGKLLQARGYRITIQKFDPYINIDPGTLNPYEHGECYVTADGMETDLDLGHYERFTGIETTCHNSITTGRIYKTVIDRERHGDYLGKTIQVVPSLRGMGVVTMKQKNYLRPSITGRGRRRVCLISLFAKSAVPLATSRVRRLWRPYVSCGGSWDVMRCACILLMCLT